MTYVKDWLAFENTLTQSQLKMEKEVADIIRNKTKDRKVFIGNMVYSTLGDMVTYCYLSDYKQGKNRFYPIWDRDNSGDFGWGDFTECCKIYDVIDKELNKNNGK